jgi:hypothetical protein
LSRFTDHGGGKVREIVEERPFELVGGRNRLRRRREGRESTRGRRRVKVSHRFELGCSRKKCLTTIVRGGRARSRKRDLRGKRWKKFREERLSLEARRSRRQERSAASRIGEEVLSFTRRRWERESSRVRRVWTV